MSVSENVSLDDKFQSLIGMLKTCLFDLALESDFLFQSLIGMLKTPQSSALHLPRLGFNPS